MKTFIKLMLISLFLLWTTGYGLRTSVFAAVPRLLNYQGRLTDAVGAPLTGSYGITFRIYDAETAGNLLWEENQPGVVVQKGVFNTLLGSIANLNLTFDKPYFLEIKVGSEVMAPRQRITSVGYAIRTERSENSEKSDVSEKIKMSSSDASPGYLAEKIDNRTIKVDSATGKLCVAPLNLQVFTSDGIFNVPSGVTKVRVQLWGAGGGGGGAGACTSSMGGGSGFSGGGGGGGGGGSYSEGYVDVTSESQIMVSVGQGGNKGIGGTNSSGSYDGTAGLAGGNSSFGSLAIAYGGQGGSGGAIGLGDGGTGGASGGIGNANVINCVNFPGSNGIKGSTSPVLGGNGGGGTCLSGIGGIAAYNFSGTAGAEPGGGGAGGSSPGNHGGDGAKGKVIVWY